MVVNASLFNFGLGAFVSLTLLGDPRVFVPGISYGALMWLTAAPVAAWARRAALRRRAGPVGQGAIGRG